MGVPKSILTAVNLPAEKVAKKPVTNLPAPERSDSDVEQEEDEQYFAEVDAELNWLHKRDAALNAWDDVQCYLQSKSAAVMDRCSFSDFEQFSAFVLSGN